MMFAVTVPVTFFDGRIVRPVNDAKMPSTSLIDAFSQLTVMCGFLALLRVQRSTARFGSRRRGRRLTDFGAESSGTGATGATFGAGAGTLSAATLGRLARASARPAACRGARPDAPRLELLGRRVDADAQLAVVVRHRIGMRRVERQHDANDRLRELRVADARDAAARDAVVRVALGQARASRRRDRATILSGLASVKCLKVTEPSTRTTTSARPVRGTTLREMTVASFGRGSAEATADVPPIAPNATSIADASVRVVNHFPLALVVSRRTSESCRVVPNSSIVNTTVV